MYCSRRDKQTHRTEQKLEIYQCLDGNLIYGQGIWPTSGEGWAID